MLAGRLAGQHQASKLLKWNGGEFQPFEESDVTTYVQAPTEWVEAVGNFKFPERVNERLQQLMTLNNEGELGEAERSELEAWVELSERFSLLRAEALQLLGRRPA